MVRWQRFLRRHWYVRHVKDDAGRIVPGYPRFGRYVRTAGRVLSDLKWLWIALAGGFASGVGYHWYECMRCLVPNGAP